MPRAAAIPTRRPVKLPGPTVTAMRSRSENSQRPASITRAISGITASAWPRAMASDSLARIAPRSESRTAAAQAPSAVSMARTRIENAAPSRIGSGTFFRDQARSDRPHLGNVGHEMTQQILDAVLERRGRRRAAGAGAFHRQEHDPVLVAAESDIAAVIGNRRTHAGFDQLLDGRDRVGVPRLEEFAGL